VRVAAAGDALLAPEVTRRVIARFAQQDALKTVTDASAPATPAPPPVAAVGPRIDLTERESEVLRLVAQALSNAEIAERLYIGEATVKTHVSNLLQKIGARDRVAAVVYAHRHGLV
jgi:DNA-binding NarL/FixJ family response regulator